MEDSNKLLDLKMENKENKFKFSKNKEIIETFKIQF